MARLTILPGKGVSTEIDIYSNKSSLILFLLLSDHSRFKKEGFSINEMTRFSDTSIGLVHKVIRQLEYIGIVKSTGLRTRKRFYLKLPDELLISWIKEYNLIKKTKTKGFAFFDTKNCGMKILPALHTASTEFFRIKKTNLNLKEFYFLDWDNLPKMKEECKLQELDRGYEVLLIKPYYSALVERLTNSSQAGMWMNSYRILTILDLLHFPIRGIEQGEALFRKTDFVSSICRWHEIENAIK